MEFFVVYYYKTQKMNIKNKILSFLISLLLISSLYGQNDNTMENKNQETATLGAGCFWCVEAVFQSLKGVESVTSGYSGGNVKNPSYREVTTGNTGHAEAIQVKFNPDVISYEEILEVFWSTHDPTTLNQQGPDIGSQYRSVIFYHSEEQKKIAEKSKKEADISGNFDDSIVTSIEPFKNFYVAEEYHQDFYKKNPNQPYCQFRINPKIKKLENEFQEYLK